MFIKPDHTEQTHSPPGDDALRNAFIDALNLTGRVVAPVSDGNYTSLYEYMYDLTPKVTTSDVRVLNFGWTGSRWNGFQAELGPGTAVLVDSTGIPRVRCLCGNPLAKPSTGGVLPVEPATFAQPGDGQVSLSWTAPASWASDEYRFYRILVDGAAVTSVGVPSSNAVAAASTSALIGGLTNGRAYSFQVQACSGGTSCATIGGSSWSNPGRTTTLAGPVTAAPAAGVPQAPAGLAAVAGPATLSASWSASAGASEYYVYLDGALAATTPQPAVLLTGLTDGRTYQLQVAGVSSAGRGARTPPVLAAPGGAAGHPTAVSATPGDGQVSLSWTAPSSWASGDYRYYRVLVDGAAVSTVGVPSGNAVAAASTSALVGGLTNGRAYYFQVQACSEYFSCATIGGGAWRTAGRVSPATAPIPATP